MARIRKVALEFALGVSRELYPREFMGLLRGRGDTILEILVIPDTTWGEGFAQVQEMHIPMDRTIVGSVHSHPTADNRPSDDDLAYFGGRGKTHLIIGWPYRVIADVACYGSDGERKELTLTG
jgi:proteasome lid subunit RPN8/RPN11